MVSDRQAALTALGLPEGASDEEVRSAYKRLSMRWHPDKNQNSSEATHMMQKLNAAKDRLEHGDSDEYDSDDEGYYYEEDYYDEDDYYNPFSNGRMDFGAFVRMFAAMHAGGMVDDRGFFLRPPPGFFKEGRRSRGGGGFCYCARCMGMRRPDDREKEMRREHARRQKIQQECAAAESRAADEADKHLQQTDPMNSRAWRRGGEHRERLVRSHFLSQTPSLLVHEANDESLVLLLDVPDVSLIDDGRLPPKGVEWEVCWCAAGDKKWTSLMAPKEYDNIVITKLTPGTEYDVKVRTGLAGSHTWAGSIDWGPWSETQQIKTSGEPPAAAAAASPAAAAAAGGKKGRPASGKKKKKNRDAAFASLLNQQQQQQQQDSDDEQQQQQGEEGDQQQQRQQTLENDLDQQQQQQQQQQQEECVEQQQQQGVEGLDQADPEQQQQQQQQSDADTDGDELPAAVVDVEQQQLEEIMGQLQQHKEKKGHKEKKEKKKHKPSEAEQEQQQQQHKEKKKHKKHKDLDLEDVDDADEQQRKEKKKEKRKQEKLAELQQQQQQQVAEQQQQQSEQESQQLEEQITPLEQQQQQQQQQPSDDELDDGFKTAVFLPKQQQPKEEEAEDDGDLEQLYERAQQQHQQLKLAHEQRQQQLSSSSRPGSSRSAGAAAADGQPADQITAESDTESGSDSSQDSDESEDLLAAAEAAAAAIEAAEAAGLPIPVSKPRKQKHHPMIMAPCVYYHLGKCTAGNACRFQHIKPNGAAAAAASAGDGSSSSSDPDVARVDTLLDSNKRSLKQMQEVVKLCKKITSQQPEPRYQPKPQEDGSYLPPLFLTSYNVADDCYATWYATTVLQGGENTRANKAKYIAMSRSRMKAMFSQAMEDPAPPAAAAAGSSGVGSSSAKVEGIGGAVVHKSAYRTQPCKWFPLGTCKYGDHCQFSHDTLAAAAAEPVRAGATQRDGANPGQDLQQQQQYLSGSSSSGRVDGVGGYLVHKSAYRTQPCKWFPLGTCKFGDHCQFIHEITPAAAAAAATAQPVCVVTPEQGSQQQQQRPVSGSSSSIVLVDQSSAAPPPAGSSSSSAGSSVPVSPQQQQKGQPQQQQQAPSFSQQQQLQRLQQYHHQQQQQQFRPPPVPVYPAIRPDVQAVPPYGYAAAGYPGVQAIPMGPRPYGSLYGPVRYKQA